MKNIFRSTKGIMRSVRTYYYVAVTVAWGLAETMLLTSPAQAQKDWSGSNDYSGTNKSIGDFASSLADIVMYAILAISFVVGAAMVVMGLIGFAQKRDNPEAAQGAPRKLMAGGALLAITIVIGVLKATLKAAG